MIELLPRRLFPWAILALVAVAFALRVLLLGVQSFWLDEGYTAHVASMNLAAIFPELADNDIHPPLHYMVLHGWRQLAGSSEFSQRFLSAAVGVLAIPLMVRLGALLFNPAVAVLSALLLTLSPLHVWYSQEARMYALFTFLSLLSVYLLLRALRGAPSSGIISGDVTPAGGSPPRLGWTLWTAYSVATGLSLLTHYYAFLLLPVGMLAVLLLGRNMRTLAKWMAAQAAAAIIFSPWLPGAANQWGHDPYTYRVPVGLDQVIKNLGTTLTIGDQALPDTAIPVIIALGAIFFLGLLTLGDRAQKSRASLVFTLVYLAAPVLLAYLLASGLGVNIKPTGGKYFILLLPPYTLILASGLVALRKVGLPLSLLATTFVVASSSFFLYNQYFHSTKEDFRSAVGYLQEHEWPGDAMILNAEHIFPPFTYYYRGNQEWYRAAVSDAETTGRWLDQTTRGRERVWLLLSHEAVSDPRGLVEAWLNAHGLLVDEKWFPGVRLAAYLMSFRPASSEEIQYPIQADFGRKIRLLGYALKPAPGGGKSLHIVLFWQSLSQVSEDLHVNLEVFDGSRRLWSQMDKGPVAETYKTSQWIPGEALKDHYELPIPPGTPPGNYILGVRLYSPGSGYGLEVSTAEGPLQRDQLQLASIFLDGRPVVSTEEAVRSIETPVMRDLGGGLLLVGGTLGSKTLYPGASLDITLLWKVVSETGKDDQLFLELAGGRGTTWGRKTLYHEYPPSFWQIGEVVREKTELSLPKDIPKGEYVVRLGSEGKAATVSLGPISVLDVDRQYTAPEIQYPQVATFGHRARLLGFDLSTASLAPGEALAVTLYWQATSPMDRDYTVFVHLLDSGNAVVAQKDNMPVKGTRPTTTWLTGEVIRDEYQIQLPRAASPGKHTIEVGMYLSSTGERLPISEAGEAEQVDRVLLSKEIAVLSTSK